MNLQNSSSRKISNIEETKAKVRAVLDKIRPSLLADGGDAEIASLTPDGHLTIYLLGACGGCTMANMTMRNGIERVVKKGVPEVVSLEAIQKE